MDLAKIIEGCIVVGAALLYYTSIVDAKRIVDGKPLKYYTRIDSGSSMLLDQYKKGKMRVN